MNIDTLLCARWVIPVEPHNTFYENHAIAIHRSRIIDILPIDKAKAEYSADEIVTLPEHTVLPGFVNMHTHSPMTLFRGLADDLDLMDWLNNHIWPAEKAWMSHTFVADGTELALAEMIRCGTVCFNEHYFYPKAAIEKVLQAQIRAQIGITILEAVSIENKGPEELLKAGSVLAEQYAGHSHVKIGLAPHAPYTVSDHLLEQIRNTSEAQNLLIHMHVQETAVEVEQEIARYGKRPMKRLQDLGLLSSKFHAVHMTQVNEEDLAILQSTGTHVVHCPESNLKLANGFCPVTKLQKAGVTVSLGTDGAASNNDLDMLGEMRTTALLGKAVSQNCAVISAAEALRMATLNGAKVLHWDHEIGSIEKGKSADVIAIDLSSINTQPVYNPISQIVYAANASQITDVWCAGKALMRERKLTTLDEEAILTKAKAWRSKIRG